MAQQTDVPKLYNQVVEEVINNVREAFLDEGVDEQVLLELKQSWESKIKQSKAVEQPSPDNLVSTYNTHMASLQQRQIVHGQQQVIRQPVPQPRPATVINKQAQLPVFNPATGTIGLSGAAQAATVALPSGLYQPQLQLQPTIFTGPDGTQYILPAQTGLVPGLSIVTNSTTAPTVLPQQLSGTQVVTAPSQPQQVQVAAQQPPQNVTQLDGPNDSSSEEDFDEEKDDDDDDDDKEENDENDEFQGEEEEPLNSGDDVSDEDPSDLFDTENVVVCQFDKINRIKNKWKFNLKDGIMNLNGKDYVFSKGNGEAEW